MAESEGGNPRDDDGGVGGGEGPRQEGRNPAADGRKIALASKLVRDRETPTAEVCGAVGVSRATPYRHLGPDGSPR